MSEIEDLFSEPYFINSEDSCIEVITKYFSKEKLEGLKILDAGCRFGEYTSALKKLRAQPTGVDINSQCIKHAIYRYPELAEQFFVADICNMKQISDNEFDIVYCLGTMPYLDKNQVFKAIDEFN